MSLAWISPSRGNPSFIEGPPSLWRRLLDKVMVRPSDRWAVTAHRSAHREAGAQERTPVPLARSVPVPIEALTQMLNTEPTLRMRLRHLALVEHSCLRAPDAPFAHLPPRAIEIAVRQLDAVLPRQPTLRVLRLQLERHLQTHRTRTLALLAAADLKWLPEGATAATSVCLAPDSMIRGPWGVTDFLETLPLEQQADRSGPGSPPELPFSVGGTAGLTLAASVEQIG